MHPPPRLTIARAESTLEEQVTEMQALDDALQARRHEVDAVRQTVKHGGAELERLSKERAERKKEVALGRAVGQGEEEDGRLVGLYDW